MSSSNTADCSACGREIQKISSYQCNEGGGVISYTCFDEQSCRAIVKDRLDRENEAEKIRREKNMKEAEEMRKTCFTSEFGFSDKKLVKIGYRENKCFRRKGTKDEFYEQDHGVESGYKLVDRESDRFKELVKAHVPVKTDEEFKERFGFDVGELTFIVRDYLCRDGGHDAYYRMEDGEWVFYRYGGASPGWRRDASKSAYEHYYYRYICQDDEEREKFEDERREMMKKRFVASWTESEERLQKKNEWNVQPAGSFSSLC